MPASKILGRIDQIDGNMLRGWVFDPSRPAKRLGVDVFVQGALFGQTTAGFARPDLAAAGFGDGRLQFLMSMASLPADALDHVTVTLTQHPDIELTLSGVRRRAAVPSARSPAEAVAFLAPLLRHLSEDAGPNMCHRRSRHPRLLATERVAGVPLSAFARHIRAKHNRPAGSSPDDIERFLDWFVCDYAVAQAPRRIPWSDEEIAFWRGPASHARSSVCRAAERFAPRAPTWSQRDAAYAWAIEDSPRLRVEDIFVDPALVEDLRAVPLGHGRSAFPLSRFMRCFLKENARLHGLPARTEAQRRIIYGVIMLYGLVSPHLLSYLPSSWLAAMLDDEGCFFQEALTAMGMRTSATASSFVDALRARGYDVVEQAWLARHEDTGPRGPVSHELQLIGPLGYTLGLGESARRVAAALMRCGVTLNLVDHDLGNASPKQDVALPLGAVSGARVTILHLNLEEIPEALAFLPDVVSRSYLIALPYLELSAPAAAHRLGLDCVREVWAASSFVQAICANVCERTHSIGMAADTRKGEPVNGALAETLRTLGVSAACLVFFVTADSLSSVHRKNLLGTIEAFQAAFPSEDNVRLLIKTHNRQAASAPLEVETWAGIRDRVAEDRRLAILDRTLDPASYRALLASVDCLVSLHRAEGLGLDVLDAMGMGIPVVATAYSGNLDFCDSRVCWPVGFRLVPVAPGIYPFAESGNVWAEPDLDEAAKALRQVYGDAAERTARTQRAVAFIAGRYGLRAFADRIDRRLTELGLAVPATGAAIPRG